MTAIQFTYMAIPLGDGRNKVHLYINALEPTWTESPRAERQAEKDALSIVSMLVDENCDETGERLLQSGNSPNDAFPVFRFTIGVIYDRVAKINHYIRIGYERVEWDAKFAPIAQLGMEQYDYTMSVLRKYEKKEYKKYLEESENKTQM